MFVGDAATFAVESEISQAYQRLSFRGLGFFVIHLGGLVYGVKAPDATLLACSFEQVCERLESRGKHDGSVFSNVDAGGVADAFTRAAYAPSSEETILGLSEAELRDAIYSNKLQWAPDGDEAFDDGSYVLQFDVGTRVRLIGFKHDSFRHEPATLREVWLEADAFYGVLSQWRDRFLAEWQAAPKEPDEY